MTKVHIRDVIPDGEVTLLNRLGDGVAKSFCSMRANFQHPSLLSSIDLEPVTTILPNLKIRAVVLGCIQRCADGVQRS